MLGLNAFDLRHNRRYEELRERGLRAISDYVEDVNAGRFPDAENVRHLPQAEVEEFTKKIYECEQADAGDD